MRKIYYLIFILTSIFICYFIVTINSNDELEGKNVIEITRIYGEPTGQTNFILADSVLLEYRYGLISIFPEYKKKDVLIKEMYWEKNFFVIKKKYVVWFYKKNNAWIVVDNIKWNDNYTKF